MDDPSVDRLCSTSAQSLMLALIAQTFIGPPSELATPEFGTTMDWNRMPPIFPLPDFPLTAAAAATQAGRAESGDAGFTSGRP